MRDRTGGDDLGEIFDEDDADLAEGGTGREEGAETLPDDGGDYDELPEESSGEIGGEPEEAAQGGIAELRKSPMMVHLLDALDAGSDIGHYGRLAFAMIARHFLSEDELVDLLGAQPGQSEARARALVLQVNQKDYSPPKRERILQWQAEQDFPICPTPDDPDSCNVYRELAFPETIYENIQEYWEEQAEAQE